MSNIVLFNTRKKITLIWTKILKKKFITKSYLYVIFGEQNICLGSKMLKSTLFNIHKVEEKYCSPTEEILH